MSSSAAERPFIFHAISSIFIALDTIFFTPFDHYSSKKQETWNFGLKPLLIAYLQKFYKLLLFSYHCLIYLLSIFIVLFISYHCFIYHCFIYLLARFNFLYSRDGYWFSLSSELFKRKRNIKK